MVAYALKYEFDNPEDLNRYARSVAEAKEDLGKALLNTAVEMVIHSVELNANFKNIDTYAFLLNKVGQKEEAKVQAEKSVKLAPEDQKKNLWSTKFLAGE